MCRRLHGDNELVATSNDYVAPYNDNVNLRATSPPSSQIDVVVVCAYEFVVDAYVVVVEAYEFVVIEAGLAAPSGQRDGRARVAASVLACSAKLCGQRDAWARSYSRNGALRTTRPGRGRD